MSGIASRKRKSLEDKFKIINEKDKKPNVSNESLAAKFDYGKSTTITEFLGK